MLTAKDAHTLTRIANLMELEKEIRQQAMGGSSF